MERWKTVAGYVGLYEVSSLGRIRSFARKGRAPIILAAHPNNHGYPSIILCKDKQHKTVVVHRLVLEAFTGPCLDGFEACHNDGNKINNRCSNLRWDTRKRNHADKQRHGTQQVGRNAFVLTEKDVRKIWSVRRKHGYGPHRIAAMHGYPFTAVQHVVYGFSWKRLTKQLKEAEANAG